MIVDTAEYEIEILSVWTAVYHLRRSDSTYKVTISPIDEMLVHLAKLDAEGFQPVGPPELRAPNRTVIRYQRKRTRPLTVAEAVTRLQQRRQDWPLTIALGPDKDGNFKEVPLDVIYEEEGRIQLRGRLPDAR